MNGLTLRINRVGSGKSRNSIGFAPVDVSHLCLDNKVANELLKDFNNVSTTDEQLMILKKILDLNKNVVDKDIIQFLVEVFLRAELKHPIKSIITRYITKNISFHQPYTDEIATQISAYIDCKPVDYKQYIVVVTRVATSIENFPIGVAAVRVVEVTLAHYLKECLQCCVKKLRETVLSPTDKNEIFNLAHLCLRLLLHIIQKANIENVCNLIRVFNDIRSFIQNLSFDDDVPMDTKSVCGILFLSMHIMEHGIHSWIDIFNPKDSDRMIREMLNNEAAELSLCSAVATVVPPERLSSIAVAGEPAVVLLTRKILEIGDRNSSESTFILGVTRTLVQICKHLDRTADSGIGLSVVDYVLMFVWAHLEHYMDSVRHLTTQALGYVVKYCVRLKMEGDEKAINNLFKALTTLDGTRKSYYVSLTCLTSDLGAHYVMSMLRDVIAELLAALSSQPIQASSTTALETLLQKHAVECDAETIYASWVKPILEHVATNSLETGVLNILENLLARALTLHDSLINLIIPYIKQSCELITVKSSHEQCDLKCILMLLSVARKSGVTNKLSAQASSDEWKGIISYDLLKRAAVDAVDETRILSLSLIVESPKSTEKFTEGDLRFVLWYLHYNINAQAPSFRQHTVSLMKKFLKRFEDSYKVLKREKNLNGPETKVDYYLNFLEDLRQQCFESLLQGANYSRRCIALQILVWCEQISLEGFERTWKPSYVEKLLLHLQDSYEANKSYALQVLEKCPVELLKSETYSISLKIESIFRQASSLKPTDCMSAAYKLDLVKRRLPEYILQGEQCEAVEPVSYVLLRKLLGRLREELSVCLRSVVLGARQAPMYGLLHCMGHFVNSLDPQTISEDAKWSSLISDMVSTCMEVNGGVACVVNNSSPEGHLPMDMSGVQVNDNGNSDGLRLDDGRLVTAQMVLLCAWRSVKEVSLLLGAISSRLSIAGEGGSTGTLSVAQMVQIGDHFTSLLAETKHRGAFEQAYVGFTKLLARLWRCRSVSLHGLPRTWLHDLMRAIGCGQSRDKLCATRRSAGLPFMIQALVATELQVQGNPKGFHECMSRLLNMAREQSPDHVETRTHALNILRALFRNAALDETVSSHVGDGLVVALNGFEGGTWAERNSSTLLFSALMVRVFGVLRSRGTDSLCVRNKMTGRIFFLRYPALYDYMLNKLQEASMNEAGQLLRPSLYPVLLLLARLYPSSLEGTVSNLKLAAYIPHVLCCARSSVLKTRQLAAKAMVPLVSPEQYVQHLESMFKILNDSSIKRNYCHGILLQLIKLLEAKPEDLNVETIDLTMCIKGTLWVLEQNLEEPPCYLILDEYVKVLDLIVWRLPTVLEINIVHKITKYLDTLIFNTKLAKINCGRDVCLANSICLYLILLDKYEINDTCTVIRKGLKHPSYEVILSTLNYFLILYDDFEAENPFQEHLQAVDKSVISKLVNDANILQALNNSLFNEYLECKQKSLKVLTLMDKSHKYNFDKKIVNNMIEEKLTEFNQNEYENLAHIYLERLLNLVSAVLKESEVYEKVLLNVIRVVLECSSSDNGDSMRKVAVEFLERNIMQLIKFNLCELDERERFELKATVWAIIIILLEDDERSYRQRISDALTNMLQSSTRVIPSLCAEMIRDYIAEKYTCEERIALFSILALLDFKSVVCMCDEVGEEARVFDQNERYNIFLEETIWTCGCADKIKRCYFKQDELEAFVLSLIHNPLYRCTFNKLCGGNLVVFEDMVTKDYIFRSDALNPKIELFVNKFRT